MLRSLLALGVLAGCAAPPALLPVVDGPAPVTSASVALGPLAAVQQPALPPALRSSTSSMDASSMDASSMDASSMDASSMDASSMTATRALTPLGDALAAYLVIHAALASDRIEGVADAARSFQAAFALAIQDAPADDLHLWHMRADETAAVLGHASSLAESTDLASARTAFGELSAPFADLVETAGAPDGSDLVRHTCGMQSDAPEGGVWLQRTGDVQNPYFGGAMQMCARSRAPVPGRTETDAAAPSGMTHGSR